MKKSEIIVYETNDHSLFKRLDGNRDIKCVKKILKSIEQVGYIPNPIMVNENMEVVDGQNRLEALKELDLPVHYYIVKGANIDTARALNLGRTNWKPLDYVKSYAEEGLSSYEYLLNLVDSTEYSVLQLYGIVTNTIVYNGAVFNKVVNNGELQIDESDHERIEQTINDLKKMDSAIRNINGSLRVVVTGLGWCLNNVKCNKSRLIKVINEKYVLIHPVIDSHPEIFLSDVSDLYNKGLKDSNSKILFDAEYRLNK